MQRKVEFRTSKFQIAMSIVFVGGFLLFITFVPAFLAVETKFLVGWLVFWTVVNLFAARWLYWQASLVYIVSDEGLSIRDYRGERHLMWDEIAGVRKWPFVGRDGSTAYNLELKSGKTQKLYNNDDAFVECLRFHLPPTKYWWSAE